MTRLRDKLKQTARSYAHAKAAQILRFLGDGNDGAVWESSRATAIKAIERADSYKRERNAYKRLAAHEVWEIEGFAVPSLIDCDDTLQVVEMTIVFPPCILDFAKSYVDRPPDFSSAVMADWESETAELFDEHWPIVESILGWLRSYGIFYFDARPGNIRFGHESDLS